MKKKSKKLKKIQSKRLKENAALENTEVFDNIIYGSGCRRGGFGGRGC